MQKFKFNPLYAKNKLEVEIPLDEMPFEPENYLVLGLPKTHQPLALHFNSFGKWMADRGTPIKAGRYAVVTRRHLFRPNTIQVKLLETYL